MHHEFEFAFARIEINDKQPDERAFHKKGKDGVLSHAPFFQKESRQPFFSQGTSQVQARVTVNEPEDAYEKEVDIMADSVVQRLSTTSANSGSSNNTAPVIHTKEMRWLQKRG